jgi:hypothetical protein
MVPRTFTTSRLENNAAKLINLVLRLTFCFHAHTTLRM